jgi:hypothetical protein
VFANCPQHHAGRDVDRDRHGAERESPVSGGAAIDALQGRVRSLDQIVAVLVEELSSQRLEGNLIVAYSKYNSTVASLGWVARSRSDWRAVD